MAAALVRHALDAEPEPLRSIMVDSAGVSALAGYPASANAVETLRKCGLSLSDHRSKPLTQDLLDTAMAVFCMTDSHRAMIEVQSPRAPQNLQLMRAFLNDDEPEIPDPFGMNLAAYEASRDSMVEAIPSIIAHLRSLVVR
jgi:protein-tyrosine phosphatase